MYTLLQHVHVAHYGGGGDTVCLAYNGKLLEYLEKVLCGVGEGRVRRHDGEKQWDEAAAKCALG